MSRVLLHRRGLALFTTMLLASCGESTLGFGLGTDSSEQAVIGGTTTSGWPGVGALTLTYAGYGYTGSFCSGTLIDDQWVLTAAHCLADHNGYEIYLQGVQFYVGTDARPNGYSEPSTGELYQAGIFYPHPSYDPDSNAFDIALVWLTEPATGVTTYAYNTTDISSLSNNVTYVGYGVSSNDGETGGGIKRTVALPISYVSPGDYSTYQGSSGVCFGDSGGPGLYNFGGTERVIGINSTVGGDPCLDGYSNQTRVDAHYVWLESVLSATAPNCNSDASVCACPAACQTAGWCDNSACQTASCRDIYSCMIDCGDDQGCSMNCYNNGSPTGQANLDAMYQCFGNYCDNVPDAQYQTCVETNCQAPMDVCFPVITGDASCEEAYDCMFDCPANDTACTQTCYETGTALAQEQMNSMWDCWDVECGTLEGDPWQACIYEKCSDEMNACWPPADCALTGGDCDAGTACYPTSSGVNDCFTSDELALDAACDPEINDRLPCDDGLICLAETQTTGSCYAFCHVIGDCSLGEQCYLFTGSDLGYCDLEPTCTDADNDGFCVEDDCDDTKAAVNPDAIESCNDNVDNNCDGFTDEGCAGCTDVDGDGYCADVDCDDTRSLVWPGAPENCADDLDNDCDTYVDDDDLMDCPSGCPDADGDGFPNGQCGGTDCNDAQSTWFPGAPEVCGDVYDKNCDGTVNPCVATGGACTDSQQCASGVCAPHFVCIDPNAVIIAPPRQVDDGGCRSSATGAPVLPTMLAFLFLLRRRRK